MKHTKILENSVYIRNVLLSRDKGISYKLTKNTINNWVGVINSLLGNKNKKAKKNIISLHLISSKKMKELNYKFRGIDCPTNVLAFPSSSKNKDSFDHLIGEVALCIEEIEKEAEEQNKETLDHLTHLFIHGVLHLIGYSHKNKKKAITMETIEKKVLKKLGIADPY